MRSGFDFVCLFFRCLWKSSGDFNKEIRVSAVSGSEIASQVFKSKKPFKTSIMRNSDSICPDFDGFGYCHILGHPIINNSDGSCIGVLMVYRDRNSSKSHHSNEFNEKDIQSASVLTSVAATTIANVTLFSESEEQRLQTEKILGIIDEMSGDVRQGYKSIIKKLVRKIRSLVTCQVLCFFF